MRVTIPFKGIVRSTDIGVCSDGECADLINGRPHKGSIIPVSPPNVVATLPEGYNTLYIHANAEFEHLICHKGSSIAITHKKVSSGYVSSFAEICTDTSIVQGCYHVGNILVLKFRRRNRYFLWKNSSYIEQSFPTTPPDIEVTKYDSSVKLSISTVKENLPHDAPILDALKNSKPQDAVIDLAKGAGLIQGDVILCVAYRLFDGNLVLPSRMVHLRCEAPKSEYSRRIIGLSKVIWEWKMSGIRAKVKVESEANSLVSSVELYAYTYSETWQFKKPLDKMELIGMASATYNRQREKSAPDVIRGMQGLYLVDSLNLNDIARGRNEFFIGADTSKKYNNTLYYGQYEIEVPFNSETVDSDVASSNISSMLSEEFSKMTIHLEPYFSSRKLNHETIQTLPPIDLSAFSNMVYATGFSTDHEYLYNGRIHAYGIQDRPELIACTLFQNGVESGDYFFEDSDGFSTKAYYNSAKVSVLLNRENMGLFVYGTNIAKMYIRDIAGYNFVAHGNLMLEKHRTLPISFFPFDSYGPKFVEDFVSEMIFGQVPSNMVENRKRKGVLKVSYVNNPLYFPLEHTYQFGGAVIAVCSSAEAVSQGQFGQYPLYVFTTEGIYAMSVGQGGSYANSVPVSRDVCVGMSSVCPIHGGVVFATKEHVKVISGSEVRIISEKLEGFLPNIDEDPVLKNIYGKMQPNPTGLSSHVISIKGDGSEEEVEEKSMKTISEFSSFLSLCTISFSPEDGLLIVSNHRFSYSYAYSLPDGEWFKWGYSPKVYLNSYPECLFENNGFVFDVHNSNRSITPILILTRPIKFDTMDFKRANQFAVRGAFIRALQALHYSGKEIVMPENKGIPIISFGRLDVIILGSQDGERYTAITGKRNIEHLRDAVMGLNRTQAYRYFCLAIVGGVRTDISINYLEADIVKTFNNRVR